MPPSSSPGAASGTAAAIRGSVDPFDDNPNTTRGPALESAETTKAGRRQAILAYDEFARLHPSIPLFAAIAVSHLDEMSKIVSDFAQWMMTQFKPLDSKKPDGQTTFRWAVGTMDGYLGKLCCNIEEKGTEYKEHKVMKSRGNDSDGWLTSIKEKMRMRCHAWAIKNGIAISSACDPARRSVVLSMSKHLFKLNTENAMRDRLLINLNYQAVHRGGEWSNMSWIFVKWNSHESNIFADKRETKTARDTQLPFVCSTNFIGCFFHSLACFLMTSEARCNFPEDPMNLVKELIFPEFSNVLPGTAASKVSDIFDKCFKAGVDGVTKNMSSTSLRCGAVDDMMLNAALDTIDAICRGGWDWEGECRILTYMSKCIRVLRAGVVLAGYDDPRVVPSCPLWTDFMTPENLDQVNALMKELFHVPDNESFANGQLDELLYNLLARILASDEEVVHTFGENNIIHVSLVRKATLLGISGATLKEWGRKAREGFEMRNRGAEDLRAGATNDERILVYSGKICNNLESAVHTINEVKDNTDKILSVTKSTDVKMDNVTELIQGNHTSQIADKERIISLQIDLLKAKDDEIAQLKRKYEPESLPTSNKSSRTVQGTPQVAVQRKAPAQNARAGANASTIGPLFDIFTGPRAPLPAAPIPPTRIVTLGRQPPRQAILLKKDVLTYSLSKWICHGAKYKLDILSPASYCIQDDENNKVRHKILKTARSLLAYANDDDKKVIKYNRERPDPVKDRVKYDEWNDEVQKTAESIAAKCSAAWMEEYNYCVDEDTCKELHWKQIARKKLKKINSVNELLNCVQRIVTHRNQNKTGRGNCPEANMLGENELFQ